MIIKGLFRRYQRWNPVHPTSGAFWGIGLGVGCGIGWGPGFGPEVIGYVGAGCGVGFSVGFTLLGLGIGLSANSLFKVPYNALFSTRDVNVEFVQPKGLLSKKKVLGDGWSKIGPHISELQSKAGGNLSSFMYEHFLESREDLIGVKTSISLHTRHLLAQIGKIQARITHPAKGSNC